MAKKYNCEINGKQYFRKTKVVGHDCNGKPIRKTFYGDGEKDADKQIEEYMSKRKNRSKCQYGEINSTRRNASMAV